MNLKMIATKNNRHFEVAPGYEWFWKIFNDGTWEPQTFAILDQFLEKDRNYFDVGAWIGPTVIYAAEKCANVFAFEPDPVAYDNLVKNIDLNLIPNVAALQAAAGVDGGMIKIGKRGEFGDSMSSSLWEKDQIEVISVKLSQMIKHHDPNLIKIDIEGGELELLPSIKEVLKEQQATLYLSLHTPWFENKKEFLEKIQDVLSIYPTLYNEKGEKIENILDYPVDHFTIVVGTYAVEQTQK